MLVLGPSWYGAIQMPNLLLLLFYYGKCTAFGKLYDNDTTIMWLFKPCERERQTDRQTGRERGTEREIEREGWKEHYLFDNTTKYNTYL